MKKPTVYVDHADSVPAPGSSLAMQVFDFAPPGCTLFPVADERSVPHLRPGEFAVVDPRDRQPEAGTLFVIEYARGTPHARRTIVEVWSRQHEHDGVPFIGWWSGPLVRIKTIIELGTELRRGRIAATVDGPQLEVHFRESLIGRVIGVLAKPPAVALYDRSSRPQVDGRAA